MAQQQQYYGHPPYQDPNAQLLQQMIASIGDDIAKAISGAAAAKGKEKEYAQGAMGEMKKFLDLEPEDRQKILSTPQGRKQVLSFLDPHLYSKHNDKKEGPAPSEESLLKFAQPTELDLAKRGKANAEFAKATSEAEAADAKTKAIAAYPDLLDKYRAKKIDSQQLIAGAVAAYGPSVLGRENITSLLDPDLLKKQESAKTIGTPEWMAQDALTRYNSLRAEYDVRTPEDEQKVRQMAASVSDPTIPYPKTMPPTFKGQEIDLSRQRKALEERTVNETSLKNDAEMYRYLSDNGVPADKQAYFVSTFRKTGKPPADMPMPKDKKLEMEMKFQDLQGQELQEKLRISKANDPEIDTLMKQVHAFQESKDDKKAKEVANKLWIKMKEKYPDMQDKPGEGWLSWIGSALTGGAKGVGNAVQAIPGIAAATGRSATSSPMSIPGAPPIVNDLAGAGMKAAGSVTSAASAFPQADLEGGSTVLNFLSRMGQYTGMMSPTDQALFQIMSQKLTNMSNDVGDFGRKASMFGSGNIIGAATLPATNDLLKQRDKFHQKLDAASQIPTLTEEQKQKILQVTTMFKDAGDDPEKLQTLLSILGHPDNFTLGGQ